MKPLSDDPADLRPWVEATASLLTGHDWTECKSNQGENKQSEGPWTNLSAWKDETGEASRTDFIELPAGCLVRTLWVREGVPAASMVFAAGVSAFDLYRALAQANPPPPFPWIPPVAPESTGCITPEDL